MSTYNATKNQSYFSKTTTRVKNYYKNYKADLQRAYDIGYATGFDQANSLPKRKGARYQATRGYYHGVSNRFKTDKYVGKYKGNKYGKN